METKTLNTAYKPSAFDWWQLELFEVIRDSHPYMLTEENMTDTLDFIAMRANAAREYFKGRILAGIPHFMAKEETREEVLIGGLRFSPTDFIAEQIYLRTGREVDTHERIEMYEKTKHLFKDLSYLHEHSEEETQLAENIAVILL